jgi:hypothetical protein
MKIGQRNDSLIVFKDLNLISLKFGTFTQQNVLIAFYAKMNHLLKKKDGCLICVNKTLSSAVQGLV